MTIFVGVKYYYKNKTEEWKFYKATSFNFALQALLLEMYCKYKPKDKYMYETVCFIIMFSQKKKLKLLKWKL